MTKPPRLVFFLCFPLVPWIPCHGTSEIPITAFIEETTGEWQTWTDRRDLLVMYHPWVPSATGGYAQAKVQARIPLESEGPYRLSLYQSDDYCNDFWRAHNDSWLGGDGFFGHRFKEVWAGAELLWESDVADANPPQVSGQLVLDLPKELQPGDSIDIALIVVDKVSSWIALASDTQHISTTETAAEKSGDPAKYWTHVYWGDVSILSASESPTVPTAPIEKIVEERHKKNWPPPPYGDPDLDLPLEFTLDCAAPLPECGFPVRCGIPLPYGKVFKATEVSLYYGSERIPYWADLRAVSYWKDTSIQWIVVQFNVSSGVEGHSFRIDRSPGFDYDSHPWPSLFWSLKSGEAGALTVVVSKGTSLGSKVIERYNWVSELSQKGLPPIEPTLLESKSDDVESIEQLGQFGFRDSTAICRYRQSGNQFGMVPIVTLSYQMVMERAFDSPFQELRLRCLFQSTRSDEFPIVESPLLEGWVESSGGDVVLEVIKNESGQTWLNGVLQQAPFPSWLALREEEKTHLFAIRNAGKTGQVGFRFERKDTAIAVECLPYTNEHSTRGYPFTPGEAKTFEVLYARLPNDALVKELEKIAANFERPPILVNNDVTCRSGAFGYALPPGDGVAEEIPKWLKTTYPDPLGTSLQWGKAPRDFGDTIYNATNSWRNGYYDLRQGFVAAYLLSGNREWADALDRAVQHFVDVDTIHSSTEHPEFIGLAHGYGENHTSMDPWDPILRMNGVLAAAHIWGNDRYYEAAMTMAKRIAETGRGLGASSVRDHAGVMMSIAAAYRETHDPLFKEAGEKLIQDIKTNRVDIRRGTYPEVHGNWNYRGNVPWMVAQLMEPLYLFYRETGNLDAAKLVVGFAESILCENQERGVPGDIYGYSHNPHFAKSSNYHILIAPCLFYAYELTGDEEFRVAATSAWKQTLREGTLNDVQNCFWNTPTLVYYLRNLGAGKQTTE